jgi:hypothetical protein
MPGAHFSLVPRAAQRSFQSPPFLVPVGLFSPRFFLERVDLDLDGRGSVRCSPSALSNAACALSMTCCRRSRSFCLAALCRCERRLFGIEAHWLLLWLHAYVLEGASGVSMVMAPRFPPTVEIDLQRPDFRIVGQASTAR